MLNQLYAVQYGKGFRYGGDNFVFFYYIARVNEKTVLIDTGFSSPKLAEQMGITLLQVKDTLENMGFYEEKADCVLITHSHWDHINDIYKYPNAVFYMEKETYQKAEAEGNDSVKEALKKAKTENRIMFLSSGMEILGTFIYEKVGGHTEDSGVFYFEHNDRKYCLAGDECFSIDYLMSNVPIDNANNHENNRKFTEKCFHEQIIPLPSHDGELFKLYESVSQNIIRIV